VIKVDAKYVFLDVVGYTTYNIENQATIVESIEGIVKGAISDCYFLGSFSSPVYYLPTGDGTCIVLENETEDDQHMKVALSVLKRIFKYNASATVKFEARIGVNENKDIAYYDINGNRNFAGRGINYASRIMSLADGGQILVGAAVFERLADTSAYQNKFKDFPVSIRHDRTITVYQFIDKTIEYLNCDKPSRI